MAKDSIDKKSENQLRKDIVNELKSKIMVDLNKEIETTIIKNTKTFRENLENEMKENIDIEIENSFKREEKKLIRSKNFSLFKRDIIIICLTTILLYFGYCLYDIKYFDFMKSECEKNGTCNQVIDSTFKENPSEVIKDKEWYIENYSYLLTNTQINITADNVSAYYLYNGDHNIKELKNAYLLNLAMKQVNEKNIKTNTVNVTVAGDTIKAAYENLFGETIPYKAGNFTYGCLSFNYNESKNKYIADNNKCVASNKQILENITDIYEEGNKLYIITMATIYDKIEKSYYTFDNLYEPVVNNVTEKDLEANKKKLNSYEYVFKKIDDAYYFDSIIKLK